MFEQPLISKERFPEEHSEIPLEIQEFISQEERALRETEADGPKRAKMMAVAFLAMSMALGSALPAMSAERAPREKAASTSEIVGKKTAKMIRAAQERQKREQEEREQKIVERLKSFHLGFFEGLKNLTSDEQKVSGVIRRIMLKKYIKDQFEEYRELNKKLGQDIFYFDQKYFLSEVANPEKMGDFLDETFGEKNFKGRAEFTGGDGDVIAFKREYNKVMGKNIYRTR